MKVTVRETPITELACDALVLGLFDEKEELSAAVQEVDATLEGLLSELLDSGELKGKLGSTTVIHAQGKLAARRIIAVGLGKPEDFDPEKLRKACANAARKARDVRCSSLATAIEGIDTGIEAGECVRAIVEGINLGLYEFKGYKREPEQTPPEVDELIVRCATGSDVGQLQQTAERARLLAEATNHARDLGNRPANKLTPTALAEAAKDMAGRVGLDYQVLNREDMEREGMGLLLGVAKGSDEPPALIVLTYEPEKSEATDTLALVGKALTFDSGGLSLKSSQGMEDMKFDMCGGAAVMGAMEAIASLAPGRRVVGIICATENMPGGHAQRPGDVRTGLTGKSVEIVNTDAEGRLVLSDGVAYAEKLGAGYIVDIATLTGAVGVALGDKAAAVIGNNDQWTNTVMEAASRSGERLWQLPTWPEYREQYKSKVADIKNMGGRGAGTITGGLIIGEFVKDAQWAHLDIAGVAWSHKQEGYRPEGATGFGVRLLAELAAR